MRMVGAEAMAGLVSYAACLTACLDALIDFLHHAKQRRDPAYSQRNIPTEDYSQRKSFPDSETGDQRCRLRFNWTTYIFAAIVSSRRRPSTTSAHEPTLASICATDCCSTVPHKIRHGTRSKGRVACDQRNRPSDRPWTTIHSLGRIGHSQRFHRS